MNEDIPLTNFESEKEADSDVDKPKDKEETKATSILKTSEELDSFFTDFLDKKSLFADKTVLQIKYLPETILHRTEQIKQLASILAPALRSEKPSNLFIYGKTGTGKTLCIKHIMNQLIGVADKRNIPLKTIYLNCKLKKIADTEYRIIAQLTRELKENVPMTGLPTEEVYNLFLKRLDISSQLVVIILDEIDNLVKKTGDEILYTLTRLNSELKNAQISFVGISNDVRFMEEIDPRIRSSLGEEELIFPPYNALELKSILAERANIAFREDVLKDDVLAKCAAYAAREHGDARRALDLLRVAAELAERENNTEVQSKHIDLAEQKIEKSRIIEIVKTQPKQSQLVMYAIFHVLDTKSKTDLTETGEIFEKYKNLCKQTGNNILTQRRISDLLSELDMLGLINAKVISKGRYGRTREIYSTIPNEMVDKLKTILTSSLF